MTTSSTLPARGAPQAGRASASLSSELGPEDLRRADGAMAVALDPQGNGAPVNWDNPQSGDQGLVHAGRRPVPAFGRDLPRLHRQRPDADRARPSCRARPAVHRAANGRSRKSQPWKGAELTGDHRALAQACAKDVAFRPHHPHIAGAAAVAPDARSGAAIRLSNWGSCMRDPYQVLGVARAPARPRSRRPIAAAPRICIPTATGTIRRRRTASPSSTAPMRSSATRPSASSSTAARSTPRASRNSRVSRAWAPAAAARRRAVSSSISARAARPFGRGGRSRLRSGRHLRLAVRRCRQARRQGLGPRRRSRRAELHARGHAGRGRDRRDAARAPAGRARGRGHDSRRRRDGKVMRLRGLGQPDPFSGEAGDVLMTIKVKPDPRFTIEGNDLRTRVRGAARARRCSAGRCMCRR